MQKNPALRELDDHELVKMAQAGDDTAFTELLARHRASCMKLALSILRNREDAEDEVQSALWKAYQHIGGFQQDARFSTWLTRIVVNQCLMRIRKNKRARMFHIDDVQIGDEIGTLELADSRGTPEGAVGQSEVNGVIETEIRRIPPLLRNVFMLREVQQLPMAVVAEQLGITVAAAKSRLLRARKELKSRMERHTGRLGPATLLAGT
jgi:RNA polymerase sigma-70 factor (ECF subfamily)